LCDVFSCRWVLFVDGNIVADLSGKINGRGAYIKKDVAVLEKAMKSKILERVLETEISDDTYDEIKEIIKN